MTRNLTQVAGSFIGTMEEFHTSEKNPLVSPIIHITDSQTDKILDTIPLGEFWDDNHHKSLKDTIEMFDFKTFGDKRYSEYLTKMNRIIIPDEDGTYIEFIIDTPIKYRSNDSLIVEVYTSASYLQLKKAKVINPQKITGMASQHLGFALNGTEFRPGIVESDKTRTIDIERHTNPYAYIKRIANELNLEPRFRIETDGNKVIGRYVDLLERVGEWRGREVEFGKDLLGIERKEDFSNIVTALIGLGPEREDGTRLEVFVEDEEALQRWGRRNPQTGELMHLIEVYEPESYDLDMTESRLRELTENELEKRVNAIVEYKTDIADLEKVPGMENKKIRFGDTIRIKDTGFNPPLYIEARVHTQDRSLSQPEKKKVILGDYIEYTEEEVNAIWNQLRNEIKRRLDRMAIVSITSTAGNIFKNAQGETELTARTFVSGTERDEDGTLYDYQWMRFDKDGNHDTSFYAEGKTITVKASDIDEKATYRVLVAYELEVINTAEITISNVFDGEDGEPGPPGPKGDKGDKGDPGPQGPPGTSVTSIVEYYLATDQSSGVTTGTPGWTTTMQQMTPQKRYLWNYERINFSDGTYQNTNPVIIGVYGDEGEEGRSIVGITEYYLATNASSGVTRSTPGWTTTMQVTTPEKKYLWNYEKITWNKVPLETYTEPVIIGVHGEQGPPGEDGQGVDNITLQYYLSDSDSTPTGGTWTETKPTYQPGKYLWIRQKITYKNPTEIEYTTPTLDDSWKAIEIAEEAKQEAEEAKTTADGKNSVFHSPTAPPTAGRKIGDVWFDTSRDNLMHRFNGIEWVEAKWGEQSIVANSITANHIKSLVGLNVNDQFIVDSEGNVKFSGTLEGASGIFRGSLTTQDPSDNSENPSKTEITYSTFYRQVNNVANEYWTHIIIDSHIDMRKYDYSGLFGPKPNSYLSGSFSISEEGIDFGVRSASSSGWYQVSIDLNGIHYFDPNNLNPKEILFRDTDIAFNTNVSVTGYIVADSLSSHYVQLGTGSIRTFSFDDPTRRAIGIYGQGHSVAEGGGTIQLYGPDDPTDNAGGIIMYENGSQRVRILNGIVRFFGRVVNQDTYDVTTSNNPNMYVATNGYYARSASAKKYKRYIEVADVDYTKILDLEAKSWYDAGEIERNNGSIEGLRRYYGAIADDFMEIGLPEYIVYGEDGEIENFNDRAWILLIPNIRDLKDSVERLEGENQYLKQKIQQLEAKLS